MIELLLLAYLLHDQKQEDVKFKEYLRDMKTPSRMNIKEFDKRANEFMKGV